VLGWLACLVVVVAAVTLTTQGKPPAPGTQANLSGAADYLTLVLFVLLGTASFLCLELYATLAPDAAVAKLQALRTWLDTHSDQVIILLSPLLGLWLAGNSLYYLA